MSVFRRISLILVTGLAVTLAGCIDQPDRSEYAPTDPTAALQTKTAATGFMPLTPGNHWTYDWEFTTQVIPEGGAPEPPTTERGTIDVEYVEYRLIGERQYILERETYLGQGTNERLRRQDHAGYYIFERLKDDGRMALSSSHRNTVRAIAARCGADINSVEAHFARVNAVRRALGGFATSPLPSPPGGPFEDEIQPLAYPLHVGATWAIRMSPSFVATVEAHEQFRGFSAWRVRIDSEFNEDDDFVHVWYSRCGEVGRRVHVVTTYVSTGGVPLGTLQTDEYVDIHDLQVGRGGCDVALDGGGGGGGKGISSYPLAVGNRWTYEVTTMQHPADGPPVAETTIVDDVQEAWVELEGQEYIRQVMRPRGIPPWELVQHLRQDSDGLYAGPTVVVGLRTDGVVPLLAAGLPRPARGPGESELTLLVYPLKVGASWKVVNLGAGQVTATVDGRETLSMPAGDFDAYRVRITNPFQNPGDEALFWYGREGVVKTYQRAATGGGGWFEESRELLELELVQ